MCNDTASLYPSYARQRDRLEPPWLVDLTGTMSGAGPCGKCCAHQGLPDEWRLEPFWAQSLGGQWVGWSLSALLNPLARQVGLKPPRHYAHREQIGLAGAFEYVVCTKAIGRALLSFLLLKSIFTTYRSLSMMLFFSFMTLKLSLTDKVWSEMSLTGSCFEGSSPRWRCYFGRLWSL